MADDGAQLEIQQQINKLLQERQALMAASSKQLQDQTQIAMQLCAALKCESLDGMTEKLEGMQGALEGAADAAEKPRNSLEAVGDAASGLSEKLDATKIAAVGAGVGLVSGFKNAMGMAAGLGKSVLGIVGSLGKVGKTILATPFKLMSGLVGMAQGGGGGPSPIRQEMEAIRGEFGDLASNEGKAVASSLGQVQSQMGDLGGTGLSVAQVYGRGPGGVAAAMKDVAELAKAIGPGLSGMTEMFQKSAVELSMYRKGLGMTADQQAIMLKQASMAGKDPVEEMNKFASMAINMGEQFGVNAKVVGKSMAEMAADTANFGQLSVKELGKAAIFTEKLGIKTKELQGVISKFDNFEDAAKGAGEMAQAFGMNVDAMELMNAQNPAERLSMLQKAFKETGKSVEDMSRQELKMLASQSGLSEEAAKLAFSQKGMSMSYDDISKGGDKAEKKQLSQAEAMDKLAGSIQKMTEGGGGGGFKGFFDAFLQGFGDGIKKSAEFRKMMKNINKSLRVVFQAGREVGKLFVEMFPGVKQLMGGLADLFDPKKFKALMGDVIGIFKDFFGDLSKDPVKATETFIERIKGAFGKFFGKQGGAASQVMEGGKKILKALGGIFTGLLSVALKGLTSLIKNITEKIKNPPQLKKGAASGIQSFGATLVKALKQLVPPLLKALFELGKTIFIKFKPQIIKVGTALLVLALTKMFITAALSAAKGAIIGKVGAIISGAVGKMFGSVAKNPASTKAADKMGKQMGKSAGLGDGIKSFIQSIASIKIADILKAAAKLSIMALSFIPVVAIFAYAAVEAYESMKSSNPLKVAAGMVAMAMTVGAALALQKAAEKISAGGIAKAVAGLLGGAVLLAVGALAFGAALAVAAPAFDGVDWKKVPMAMIGLAVAAFAALGLSIAGAALNPAMAGTALLGLLAGAAMIAVGGLAFALGLAVANVAMEAIDMKKAAFNLLMLNLVAFATVPLALSAAVLGAVAPAAVPGLIAGGIMIGVGALAFGLALLIFDKTIGKLDMVKISAYMGLMAITAIAALPLAVASIALGSIAIAGSVGAVFAAGFIGVGALALAAALGITGAVMDKVDMPKAAIGFLAMALTIAAAIPMAMGSVILGTYAVPATVGAVLGAVFLGVGALALATALGVVANQMASVDMKGAAIGMGFMAIALLAAVPMAIAATALAIPAVLGMIGVFPAAGFMALVTKLLVPPLQDFANAKIDGSKLASNAGALAIAIVALGMTAVAAALLIPFAAPFIGGFLMKKGIKLIGDFMNLIATELIGPLTAFAGMPIPAGSGLGQKIDILMAAVEGVALLGGVAIGLAAIDNAAMEEGGKQGGTIKAVESFMKVLLGGMVGMINAIAELGKAIPAEQIGAVQAVAKIIQGLGELIGGVVPPIAGLALSMMAASTEGGGIFSSGKVNTDKFNSMMGSIKGLISGIFGIMGEQIKPMITDILKIEIPGGVDAAKPKLEVISTVVDTMTKFLEPMQKVLEMMNKQEEKKGFFEKMFKKVEDPAKGMMAQLKTIMTGLVAMIKDNLNPIVQTILGVEIDNPEAAGAKIKLVGSAVDIMGNMTGQLFKTLDMVKGSGKKPNMKNLEILFGPPGNPQKSMMYQIAKSAGEGIKVVVKSIVDAVAGFKPATVEPAVKLVAAAIDSVSKFAKSIIDVMAIAPKAGSVKALEKALPAVLNVMKKISAQIAISLPEVINPIMTIAKKAGKSKGAAKGMELVSKAIGAVGQFAGALKDVMSLVPSNPKAEVKQDKLQEVLTVVRGVSGVIKTELPDLVKHIGKAADGTASIKESSIKKVSTIMEAVGKFATALKDIMSVLPPLGKGEEKKMSERLEVIGEVAKAATKGIETIIGNETAGLTALALGVQKSKVTHSSINKLNKFFKGIVLFAEGLKALSGLGSADAGVKEVIASLAGSITENAEPMKDMIKTLSEFDAGQLKTAGSNMTKFSNMITKSVGPAFNVLESMEGMTAAKVTTINDAITEAKTLLTNIGDEEMVGVIDLAKVLAKPGKQEINLKVEHPQIKATFEININAAQFAKALAATGELTATGDGSK